MLSFRHTKQTSKNVADTTLRTHLRGKFKVFKYTIREVNVKIKKQCWIASASLCKETYHIGIKIENSHGFPNIGHLSSTCTLDSEKNTEN